MSEKQITSPIKAIRAKCIDCCCGSVNEADMCTAKDCPLYPFRHGKNPFYTRVLDDETREKSRQRMIALNEKKKKEKAPC